MRQLTFAFKDLNHLDDILSTLEPRSYDIVKLRRHSITLHIKKYSIRKSSMFSQAYVQKTMEVTS